MTMNFPPFQGGLRGVAEPVQAVVLGETKQSRFNAEKRTGRLGGILLRKIGGILYFNNFGNYNSVA